MKKLVTVLLVVAMVLSLCSVAFAADFSDTKDLGKDAKASIAKLSGLEIINGYPDGTFKPGNTITRAEFAKIACIAGGMGASANVLQNSPSQFTDVAAGQWYTGYINLASSQSWVKGFPDGTFRPNNQITYAEVITVLVRLLGYNDNLPGPWPVDYIAKAGALDITKGVAFNSNGAATRADVAVMADATLDCTVVVWDNDIEDFKYKDGKNYTLLDDSFDSAINEDYLVTAVTYDKGAWYITVAGTDETELDGKKELAENYVISNGVLPSDLNNKIVDVLYNTDDKVATYIEVTSTTVKADGEDWKYAKGEFEIDDVDYDKAEYFVGDEYDRTWDEKEKKYTGDAEYDGDSYYMAYINADDEIYKVSKQSDKTPAIVEAYEDGELSLKDEGDYELYNKIEKIDFEDDKVLIKKGNAYVDADELAENDVIYVEKKYGFDYYIDVVGSLSKTGNLDAVKDNALKIDGTWYDIDVEGALSDDGGDNFNKAINSTNLKDSDDETITYFLNKANQVSYVITSEVGDSNKIYGVVTDLGYRITKSGNMVTDITVLTADGTEVDYDVDTSEVELYMPKDGLDEEFLEELYFVKFAVNDDNEIDSLTVLSDSTPTGYTISDSNDDTNRVKVDGVWYKVTDKTVVFNGAKDVDDAEVVKNADFIDWAEVGGSAYVQKSGTEIEYVYLNEAAISGSTADYALVLSNYIKGGDYWVEIDVTGDSQDYKLKSQVKENRPVENAIYDYSISSSKFTGDEKTFDPDANSLAGKAAVDAEVYQLSDAKTVYYEVQDVDRADKAVKVNGQWLYADEDAVIYDYTDYYASNGKDDPEYGSSIRTISKGDYIVYVGDKKDEVKLFIIVTNIK